MHMVEFCLVVLSGKGVVSNLNRKILYAFLGLVIQDKICGYLAFSFPCRIIRAFLVEEQKIVKKVLKLQKTKEKQSKS